MLQSGFHLTFPCPIVMLDFLASSALSDIKSMMKCGDLLFPPCNFAIEGREAIRKKWPSGRSMDKCGETTSNGWPANHYPGMADFVMEGGHIHKTLQKVSESEFVDRVSCYSTTSRSMLAVWRWFRIFQWEWRKRAAGEKGTDIADRKTENGKTVVNATGRPSLTYTASWPWHDITDSPWADNLVKTFTTDPNWDRLFFVKCRTLRDLQSIQFLISDKALRKKSQTFSN
jgi:hypothetical protein